MQRANGRPADVKPVGDRRRGTAEHPVGVKLTGRAGQGEMTCGLGERLPARGAAENARHRRYAPALAHGARERATAGAPLAMRERQKSTGLPSLTQHALNLPTRTITHCASFGWKRIVAQRIYMSSWDFIGFEQQCGFEPAVTGCPICIGFASVSALCQRDDRNQRAYASANGPTLPQMATWGRYFSASTDKLRPTGLPVEADGPAAGSCPLIQVKGGGLVLPEKVDASVTSNCPFVQVKSIGAVYLQKRTSKPVRNVHFVRQPRREGRPLTPYRRTTSHTGPPRHMRQEPRPPAAGPIVSAAGPIVTRPCPSAAPRLSSRLSYTAQRSSHETRGHHQQALP